MAKPLVGISGKANAGKDTVADYLLTRGWRHKMSFAGNLKKVCSEVFGIDIKFFNDQELKNKPFDTPLRISTDMAHEIVRAALGDDKLFLWDSMVIIGTPRALLQYVGTDLLRYVDQDCHVNIFKRFAGDDLSGFVVPDVRFTNEAEFILESGGLLLRVDRSEEFLNTNDHLSETSLDDWDRWTYRIDSGRNGVDFLYEKVDEMLDYLSL